MYANIQQLSRPYNLYSSCKQKIRVIFHHRFNVTMRHELGDLNTDYALKYRIQLGDLNTDHALKYRIQPPLLNPLAESLKLEFYN